MAEKIIAHFPIEEECGVDVKIKASPKIVTLDMFDEHSEMDVCFDIKEAEEFLVRFTEALAYAKEAKR